MQVGKRRAMEMGAGGYYLRGEVTRHRGVSIRNWLFFADLWQ